MEKRGKKKDQTKIPLGCVKGNEDFQPPPKAVQHTQLSHVSLRGFWLRSAFKTLHSSAEVLSNKRIELCIYKLKRH